MLFAVVALLVTSCGDKTSEGKSRFTYYPTIELEGDTYLVWDKGTPWHDLFGGAPHARRPRSLQHSAA